MPSLLSGAAFGAMIGTLLSGSLPEEWDIQPGVLAILSATATLAAVFRSSIAVTIIVVEGTRGIDFLGGIIISVIVSNWIAHYIHPSGIYESELERDGRIFFLRPVRFIYFLFFVFCF